MARNGRGGGGGIWCSWFVQLRETIDPSRLGSTWINGVIDSRIKVTFFPKFSEIAL